ncbi:MAG: DEAD/DEAH box helicase [Gammaproteobacteria bacterium]|nr:DEAD/DEAH box helicase [Gammaproteobacteria bacterium]
MTNTDSTDLSFNDLSLSTPIIKALKNVGYESPSPIQAKIIPFVMDGRDVIGQAQTGTGKTAAFALPLLSKINLRLTTPQILVLTPTRELAIQVSEAFQRYAKFLNGFHVLPIYGGQEYGVQLRQLKRGVHIVVGTPGRVMDHMRRGTLKMENITCLVLDEADEMLRMGFIDDVKWVLEQLPKQRQIALFSATIPTPIRNISKRYLKKPEQITIEAKSITADTVRQRYVLVNGREKLDSLTTILESMTFNAIIIFVRTKITTVELSEKLAARGYACTALNGDITQKLREQTIRRLKSGKLDMLIATDVAARGLDVKRISHVINYDIPSDPEAYTHRIGRTGRMGCEGETILFVTPREKHLLRIIEKGTSKKIERMSMPTAEVINQERIQRFKQSITNALEVNENQLFRTIIEEYQNETGHSAISIATALAKLSKGSEPFLIVSEKKKEKSKPNGFGKARKSKQAKPERDMERFRIEVGKNHDVKASNIVGAISNEAGVESRYIKNVTIYDDYATLDLPNEMPRNIFNMLKKVWVCGKQLNISYLSEKSEPTNKKRNKKGKKPPSKKKQHTKSKRKHSRKRKNKSS